MGLMKVFAILLCLLVALCVADDMQATCTVFDTTGCGSAASIDLGDWTEVTVNATSSLCHTAAYTTDDSDEDYFVIAVRPGGDAANATLPTLSGSISPAASNGTAPLPRLFALKSNPPKRMTIWTTPAPLLPTPPLLVPLETSPSRLSTLVPPPLPLKSMPVSPMVMLVVLPSSPLVAAGGGSSLSSSSLSSSSSSPLPSVVSCT